ncbi:hypothetical protein [Halostagnicola kamekurae]|uniref:Uncharacterized protein n=1 Tax=Halostagnicola kamekurae TaxID=619731 RepID=A0A1I6TF14_9EURY|nr:hypothetical protein SAMN04488556_3063 [Halostagnicola kamekurae]
MSVDDARGTLEGIFRDTHYDDPSEEFVEGMLAPWDSQAAIISLSCNAIGTNTSHTTETDTSEVTTRRRHP